MGKKKKRFIDKKTAHSFQLVHRSQKDPLQADEDSSKHVLVSLDGETQGASSQNSNPTRGDKLEERQQYGIDFDDDYDYMQHLKTRTDCTLEPLPENITVIEDEKKKKKFGKLQLPLEAFASEYEENEGMLNLAAPAPGPHPDWDPEIVAALDGDFDENDPVNILEDDFFVKANASSFPEDGDSDDDLIKSDDEDSDEYFPSDEGEGFDGSEGSAFSFGNEETKSRFTNYSMTSSVIRRNEGLTLLDNRFEKVMEEYDEDEFGALDHEEMTGTVDPDSHIINALAKDFEHNVHKVHFADAEESNDNVQDINQVQEKNSESCSDDDLDVVKIDVASKEQWDCESILSTYSNLYNHPTLIKEVSKAKHIKLSSKTGIPLGIIPGKVSAKTNVCDDTMDVEITKMSTGPRPKHEDKEDKAQRKKAVKEQRKARRIEKKSNKQTFKAEQKRQVQSLLHTKQQQGQKL